MSTLKDALDQMISAGRRPTAVIVDDELDSIGVPTFPEWVSLDDILQQDPDFRDTVREQLTVKGHSPQDPPSIDLLTTILQELTIPDNIGIKSALETYVRSQHVLQKLNTCLLNLGFSVERFATPTFSSPGDEFLYLVDYQIIPEEASGETASRLLDFLMNRAAENERRPPFVILMSKALTEDDIDKWSQVADKAGFFRFNYCFLNKDNFVTDPAYLEYPLLYFIRHEQLSSAYYLQMNSLAAEASNIGKSVSKRLFQVSPTEALLFKRKIYEEGSSLSEELSSLFAELFSKALKLSERVVSRMKALDEAISRDPLPVPYRQQSSVLHHLYADLLHQTCDGLDNDPSFGDIYEDGAGRYFLVLSQECDIAHGEGRKLKSNRVVMIEGELKNSGLPGKSEMIVAKPIFIAGNDQRMWLCWNLGSPVVLPFEIFAPKSVRDKHTATRAYFIGENRLRTGLPGNAHEDWCEAERQIQNEYCPGIPKNLLNLRKKWKLRFADADDLQHQFATRMTRVALNVMPSLIHVHSLRLSHDATVIDETPSVYIYEALDEPKKKFALAPESLGACAAADSGAFISASLIDFLSHFVSFKEFSDKLDGEKLFITEENNVLLLSKYSQGFKRGRAPWKGLP